MIPAGWFLRREDEVRQSHQPQRRVYLDAFAIGYTEVTNGACDVFLVETGHDEMKDAGQRKAYGDAPVRGPTR